MGVTRLLVHVVGVVRALCPRAARLEADGEDAALHASAALRVALAPRAELALAPGAYTRPH
jgi:hypothetical protein